MIQNFFDLGMPIGVGMYLALMGTFNIPEPIELVETRPRYTIVPANEHHEINLIYFKTQYFMIHGKYRTYILNQ